jgi:putative Holliday junction resolvase
MQDFKNYPNYTKFEGKNMLAIDYGEKVIGLAAFTPGREPFPLGRGRIVNKGMDNFITELAEIIEEDFTEVIIFGVPYLTDGTETDKSREMINKMNILKNHFSDIEFYIQDETLTTNAAKERMLNSAQYNFQIDLKKIDEVSAIIILEEFIQHT